MELSRLAHVKDGVISIAEVDGWQELLNEMALQLAGRAPILCRRLSATKDGIAQDAEKAYYRGGKWQVSQQPSNLSSSLKG